MRKFFEEYKKPIAIFLVSRIIIVLVFYFLSNYQFGIPQFGQWDARSYLSIAEEGYKVEPGYKNGGSFIAFFPLFPLLVGILSQASGLEVLSSALILNLLFGIGSAVLIYKIAKKWWGEAIAINSVLLFSFFPTSIFLTVPYTESLFIFLTLSTFVLLEKKEFEASSITIALAIVTRITGFVLIPLLLYYLYKEKEKLIYWPLYLITSLSPFLSFLYYQYLNFHTPFAFLEAQKANWYHSLTYPWVGLTNLVRLAASKSDISLMWRSDLLMLTIMMVTLLFSRKVINRFFVFLGIGVVLLTISQTFVLGTSRYMILVIPFYFFWAKYLAKKPLVFQLVILTSASWLAFNSALFFLSKSIF